MLGESRRKWAAKEPADQADGRPASLWPLTFPPDNSYRTGKRCPPGRACPRATGYRGHKSSNHNQGGARTNGIQRGGSWRSSKHSRPPVQVEMSRRQAPHCGGRYPRGVCVRPTAPPLGAWFQPAEHQPGSDLQGSLVLRGFVGQRPPGQPCHPGARLRDPGFREGWGGPSPASGAEALGPGEAAHLAVASARLVHEGAVLTGPHGGRGGV